MCVQAQCCQHGHRFHLCSDEEAKDVLVLGLLTASPAKLYYLKAGCPDECGVPWDGTQLGLWIEIGPGRVWSLELMYNYSYRTSTSGETFDAFAKALDHQYGSALRGNVGAPCL